MDILTRKEAIDLGLPRYFTGKPCKAGHLDERRVGNSDCLTCVDERNEKYRSDPSNKEAAKARSKKWREAMGSEAYYQYVLAIKIKNYGSNANYWRDYNSRNREYHSLRTALWCADHPEKKRSLDRNRKARVKNAEGTHTADDVAATYARQNGICVYCSTDLSSGYHVDHIMPLALGGSNWPSNIQCLCPTCNTRKGAKHPDDWHTEIGYINQ